MKFITDILTENDNATYCIARVLVLVAVVSFIGFAGYEEYNSKSFKALDFANGIMQILAGGATIIGAKTFVSKDTK